MQMGAACGFNHQAIMAINGDQRRKPDHPGANSGKREGVGLPINVFMLEVRAPCLGIGESQACRNAESSG